MPRQRLFQYMRCVAAAQVGCAYIRLQHGSIRWCNAVRDDGPGAFSRRQSAQVGKPDFGDQDIDIVFRVIDM